MPELISNIQTPTGDAELAQQLKAGDDAACAILVERYGARLFATLCRLTGNRADAEDVLQEALMNAISNIASFNGGSGLYSWLYRIAVNAGLTRLRKQTRRARIETFSADAAMNDGDGTMRDMIADPAAETPESFAGRAETVARVRAEIAALPDGYREAIVMRDIDGLSYDETAVALGITVAAVKSRIHRARLLLADAMADLRV